MWNLGYSTTDASRKVLYADTKVVQNSPYGGLTFTAQREKPQQQTEVQVVRVKGGQLLKTLGLESQEMAKLIKHTH